MALYYNVFLLQHKKGNNLLIGSSINPNNYHKRKRHSYYSGIQSLRSPYQNSITKDNSINKPLKVRGTNEPTFKGFYNSNWLKKLFLTTTEALPKNLSKFTFDNLEKLGKEEAKRLKQAKTYESIVLDFIKAVKDEKDLSFRKKIGISDEWVKKITKDNLPNLPQKGQLVKFVETVFDPFVAIFNLYKPVVRSKFGKEIFPQLHNKLIKEKQQELLIEQYKGFLGLNNAVKNWENSYRKFSGNPIWGEDSEFLIPEDNLIKKLQRRLPNAFNPDKGKYSTKSLLLGNRLISGLIYSVYLSTDAFNTTMKFSGDKEESQKQQKSRFAQENARVGLNLYLQNLIFSTFQPQMNKNIVNALLASGATVALSEITGRQLVSKPIMPSDKKTLDDLEQKMLSKKGVLPSIGRLMTRVKKTDRPKISTPSQTTFNPTMKALPKPFGAFTASNNKLNNQISFKGNIPQMFDSKKLESMLKILKEYDLSQFEYYKKMIEQGFKIIKKVDGKDISAMTLEDAIKNIPSVPIGETQTISTKFLKSIFAPFYWIKNGTKSISEKLNKLSPKKSLNEMTEFIKKNEFEDEYQSFLEKRLEHPAWKNSYLKDIDLKKAKIMQEFVESKKQIKEEIKGVKNVILWLDKQIKLKKFDLKGLTDTQKLELENELKKAMTILDGSNQIDYDGNALTQLNIHVARIITTIFLVTDAYNLTMQYSNDNKKESRQSAKNRAVQEITRISVSAYMLGVFHSLLSKVCNSSLLGAFAVTALTATTNDTLSRLFVGVPLTPQSQDKLLKK